MGHYDTKRLPIYAYLHGRKAPDYAIADRFFQGAFGGSFLNHQWLIAAATPVFTGALSDGSSSDLHSLVDTNGFPTPRTRSTADGRGQGRRADPCRAAVAATRPAARCGDYAVNTIQPTYQPHGLAARSCRRRRARRSATG